MNFYKITYRMTNGDLNHMGVAASSMTKACHIFEKHFNDMDCSVDEIDTTGNLVQMVSCVCLEEFRDIVLS